MNIYESLIWFSLLITTLVFGIHFCNLKRASCSMKVNLWYLLCLLNIFSAQSINQEVQKREWTKGKVLQNGRTYACSNNSWLQIKRGTPPKMQQNILNINVSAANNSECRRTAKWIHTPSNSSMCSIHSRDPTNFRVALNQWSFQIIHIKWMRTNTLKGFAQNMH